MKQDIDLQSYDVFTAARGLGYHGWLAQRDPYYHQRAEADWVQLTIHGSLVSFVIFSVTGHDSVGRMHQASSVGYAHVKQAILPRAR